MAHGDPTPGLGKGAIPYAIFLCIKPCKALTSTVIDQYATHLAELDREGRLVLAGPLLARFSGLIVLGVLSLAEAKAIAEADPMIRGGCQSYELAACMMAYKQNHYQPTAQMGGKS